MAKAKQEFKTEVKQLLDLVIHSLYSDKEIFLRELVSNASDAIDKLKFLSLTDKKLKDFDVKEKIFINFDEKDNSISVIDTGIGMDEDDLNDHLGTIAKSGTKGFLSQLTGDQKKDSNLIGQFGVGFYSTFMVASEVHVITKKAGNDKAYKWVSNADGTYEITEITKESNGTVVYMRLKDDAKEFCNKSRLETIIEKYSNHVPFQIFLNYMDETTEELSEEDKKANKEAKVTKTPKSELINSAKALWTIPKKDLKKSDYNEFYKNISHGEDEALSYVHTKAEGAIEYTTLFFIPKKAPFDLYRVDYQSGLKLYVNRVFITDDDKELLPSYLRFVKGVIDCADLPLNVSREILQQNKILANIKQASVKKILGQIKKVTKNKEEYNEFIKEFNRPLKEGLYQDYANRDALLELVRFKSTKVENGYQSLAEYKEAMGSEQKSIYYIVGDNEATLRHSPLLESFKAKDIEVLILDDELDDMIITSIDKYKDIEIKSVNRTDTSKDLDSKEDEKINKEAEGIVKKIKDALGDDVKDVRASSRLSDSPSCIVVDQDDPTLQMQNMMKAMGQAMPGDGTVKPILEINPTHDIITKLDKAEDKTTIEDVSRLLLEQAMIYEGMKLKDVHSFNARLNRVLKGFLA